MLPQEIIRRKRNKEVLSATEISSCLSYYSLTVFSSFL